MGGIVTEHLIRIQGAREPDHLKPVHTSDERRIKRVIRIRDGAVFVTRQQQADVPDGVARGGLLDLDLDPDIWFHRKRIADLATRALIGPGDRGIPFLRGLTGIPADTDFSLSGELERVVT